jgi:dTDP-4-amino-4,6-dideoxygalactose transaminase
MGKPMNDASVKTVPLADPRRDMAMLKAQLIEAAGRVIDSGYYINGSEVKAFEASLAEALAQPHPVVGVGSGTDALIMALLSLGVGPGDEVVVPSHTAGPSVAAINAVRATPVFADVEADTACLDPAAVEAAISARTKAILAVHLYGHPADLDRLLPMAQARGIALIEDCAQAQGAFLHERAIGSIGDLGCFSFYPTKNLGAIGDGGAVSGRNDLLDKVRKLRTYGWSKPQYSDLALGRCSRLDEIQAAFLNIKLPHLAEAVDARRRISGHYRAELQGLPLTLPVERPGARHAYHLFVVQTDARDKLAAHLSERGVATGLHYPFPVHVQPGLAEGARVSGSLHVTETLQKTILSLPIFASMTDAEISQVTDAVRDFYR